MEEIAERFQQLKLIDNALKLLDEQLMFKLLDEKLIVNTELMVKLQKVQELKSRAMEEIDVRYQQLKLIDKALKLLLEQPISRFQLLQSRYQKAKFKVERYRMKRKPHKIIADYSRGVIFMVLVSKRLKTKQSILNTEPEVTVICVDNSCLVAEVHGGCTHKAQAEAIALYSEEKIKAHPRNLVALLAMGMLEGTCSVRPTRDLDQIRFALNGLMYTGLACIPMGHALSFFTKCQLPKRRLLVFSGGRLGMDSVQLQFFAKRFKDYKVAVDVVNFGIQPKTKKQLLQEFVEAADNCGNSHYLYAPSGSTTSLGQQILRSPLAPGGLPMQEEMKRKEEVTKRKMANAKMKNKKLHMTKNLTSALAPQGLSMREVKKKEKHIKKMDNKEKQAKRKEELAKEEEKQFWAFMHIHSYIP